MQTDDRNVLAFAAMVCVACSVLLSGAAAGLKSRQEYNVELDRKTNVLKAFGVAVRDDSGKKVLTGEVVDRYFTENISEIVLDAESGSVLEGMSSADLSRDDVKLKTKLPLYMWKEGGSIQKYAFPTSGKGLWSTIYGYIALERDLGTIVGITFYKHGETPGLGGEVDQGWFQDNFKGQKLYANGQLLPFEVVKGGVDSKYPQGNDHAVDGISGATITGRGVQDFLREDMAAYNKYFQTIRGS